MEFPTLYYGKSWSELISPAESKYGNYLLRGSIVDSQGKNNTMNDQRLNKWCGKYRIPQRAPFNINNFYSSVSPNTYFHRHRPVYYGNQLVPDKPIPWPGGTSVPSPGRNSWFPAHLQYKYGNQLQVNGDRYFGACSAVKTAKKSCNQIDYSFADILDGYSVFCGSKPKQPIKCPCLNDGEKIFVCGICGKSFKVFGDFGYLQRCHAGELLYTPQLEKWNQKMTLMQYERVLQRYHIARSAHMKRTLEHRDPYRCRICLKKFTTASDARRHVDSVHNELRPYKCTACGKSFSRKDNLQRHVVICKFRNDQVTQKLPCSSTNAINFEEVLTAQVADDFVGGVGLRRENWRHMMELCNLRGRSENTRIVNDWESVDKEPLDLRVQSKISL